MGTLGPRGSQPVHEPDPRIIGDQCQSLASWLGQLPKVHITMIARQLRRNIHRFYPDPHFTDLYSAFVDVDEFLGSQSKSCMASLCLPTSTWPPGLLKVLPKRLEKMQLVTLTTDFFASLHPCLLKGILQIPMGHDVRMAHYRSLKSAKVL